MGEERKTVDNCFSRTKSTKQREMKQGYALSTFRLCDLTGHVELKTAYELYIIEICLILCYN